VTDAQQLADEEILEFAEQMEVSSNKLGTRIIANFMREALPLSSDATRELVGDLRVTTMTAVGKEFSATPRTGGGDRRLCRSHGGHALRVSHKHCHEAT